MKRIAFAIAAALAVFSTASSAQSAKPISLGVSLGAAIPIGDFGDLYQTGYNGTVSLGFQSSGSPLGIRFDGMYNKFPDRSDLVIPRPDYRIVGGSANLVYALPGVGIRPYLIGGGGYYGLKADIENAETFSDFGVNGGLGASFQLSGFSTFVEARLHHIFSDEATQFIPITFGISL